MHEAGGTILSERWLPDGVIAECIGLAEEQELTLAAYCGERIVAEVTNSHTDRLLFYREPPPEAVGCLRTTLLGAGSLRVHKLLFMEQNTRIQVRDQTIYALQWLCLMPSHSCRRQAIHSFGMKVGAVHGMHGMTIFLAHTFGTPERGIAWKYMSVLHMAEPCKLLEWDHCTVFAHVCYKHGRLLPCCREDVFDAVQWSSCRLCGQELRRLWRVKRLSRLR